MLKRLDQISKSAKLPRRLSSGWEHFDMMLGTSTFNGVEESGFVIGGMYYFFGEPGVGKSRLTIQIMENLANEGKISLICQGEADENAFASWCANKPEKVQNSIYLTDDMDFEELMKMITELRPALVVIDSANMVNGIEGIEDLKKKYKRWSKTVSDANSVCIMLGHLNQDGTLKGRTEVPHLVDVVGILTRPKLKRGPIAIDIKDSAGNNRTVRWEWPPIFHKIVFRVEIPTKNRFGKSGFRCDFAHNSHGVEYITSDFETDYRALAWMLPLETYAEHLFQKLIAKENSDSVGRTQKRPVRKRGMFDWWRS
jgi:KaiC/GvpD/RAD55 family RecA-like ATPase